MNSEEKQYNRLRLQGRMIFQSIYRLPMVLKDRIESRIPTMRQCLLSLFPWLKSNSDFTHIPEKLQALVESLQSASREVELEFLTVGRELQRVYSDAATLSQRTLDTMHLVGGDGDEGVLNKIDQIVGNALTELRLSIEQVNADIGQFTVGAGHMGELNNQCAIIEEMALVLRMVGLNIGVESSRSADAREMFGVVEVEVRALSEKIGKIAVNIRDSSHVAQCQQQTAHDEISKGITEMSLVAADAEQAVMDAAGKTKDLIGLSLTAMAQAEANSRQITEQIGRIVVGIQFHDNMNQRIEHINEALRDVMDILSKAGCNAQPKKDGGACLAQTHKIVDIQISQLKQLIAEIKEIYGQNTRAFEAIIDRVGDLANSLTLFGVGSASDRGGGGDGSFPALTAALDRFQALLESGRQLHGYIRKTFDHATKAVAGLSGYAEEVRRTNFEIHIMALNAIVKAAHMGTDGRALEVLAQAVKTLSDQSNVFVANVNTLLNQIVATVHTQQTAGGGIRENPNTTAVEISAVEAMEQSVKQITLTHEKLKTDSAGLLVSAGELKETTTNTRIRLDFFAGLIDRLTFCLNELEDIGDALKPWAGQITENTSVEAGRLAARYTMAQERNIHDGRLDAATGALPSLAAGSEGLGTQIDLFDDISAVAEPAIEAIAATGDDEESLGNNVEFF